MSSVPGRKDGNGNVLEVGPPLVPRHRPEGGPPAPPPAKPLPKPPLPPSTATPQEPTWDSVDELLSDVDAGFGAITVEHEPPIDAPPSGFKSPSGGLSNARELFGQLAVVHFRHVRDFMIDVKAGQATTEWLALCEPSVKSVRQMAEQLALSELGKLLDGYLAALALAGSESGFTIGGEVREKVLAAYEPLVAHMPAVFGLDAAKSQREGVIVKALLQQIPEVHKVALDKLFLAGLTTLETYFAARADEIAATTGLEPAIAEKIVERFARYKKETQSAAIDESRTFEHARLGDLVAELDSQNAAYDGEKGAKKREVRKAREATLLEIKVLMARLGEVERVAKIDKLPFAQKVVELTAYLKSKV